jgi:hypothetical protein
LIVSQPPYYPNRILNTGGGLTFLHGGERGDELARAVMSGLPTHLSPNGRALVFASWPESEPITIPGHDVLELHTNRRELHGARQSISIVRAHGPGDNWSERFEVSAECWGAVQPSRINEIFASIDLLHGPVHDFLAAALRLPRQCTYLREAEQCLIQYPDESLIGLKPVDDLTWYILSSVNASPCVAAAGLDAGSLEVLKRALHHGLLTPEL